MPTRSAGHALGSHGDESAEHTEETEGREAVVASRAMRRWFREKMEIWVACKNCPDAGRAKTRSRCAEHPICARPHQVAPADPPADKQESGGAVVPAAVASPSAPCPFRRRGRPTTLGSHGDESAEHRGDRGPRGPTRAERSQRCDHDGWYTLGVPTWTYIHDYLSYS